MFSRHDSSSLCGLALFLLFAGASSAQEVCSSSPEDAAANFVTWSIEDARRTAELVQPKNLKQFRLRLQQIVDSRYAPDSAPFRERLLGAEWTQERISAVSDKELVGQFLAAGGQRRRGWRVSDVRPVESRRGHFAGREVIISYRIETPAGSSTQRREFSAHQSGKCWVVEVPLEAWVRLDEIAKIMKDSRQRVDIPRQGPPRVEFQVAAASTSNRPGMREIPRRVETGSIWVESPALVTGKEVVGAYSAWDCEAVGLGPEHPAVWLTFSAEGANALRRWTESNRGSMLAVVMNERVVLFARVDGVLGSRLQICLPGEALEQAQTLAADLMGAPK